jgi:hypothetical protein
VSLRERSEPLRKDEEACCMLRETHRKKVSRRKMNCASEKSGKSSKLIHMGFDLHEMENG